MSTFDEYMAARAAARKAARGECGRRKATPSQPYKPVQYQVPEKKLSEYPDLWASQSGVDHTTTALRPNISCYQATQGGYCQNKHCLTHGHYIRERQAIRRQRYNFENYDTFVCTLPFACWLGYYQFRQVVKRFLHAVRLKRKGLGTFHYWYETEFVDVIPHLHFVFRLPVGGRKFQDVEDRVKACWKAALVGSGVPWLSQRVSVQAEGKTWADVRQLTRYNHKTNPGSIPINNCRPVG